jgi:hypothetical protein
MPPVAKNTLAPFAVLPTPDYCRASFFGFLLSPFRDVDDRVALKAAAAAAERLARRGAMFGGDAERLS